MHVSDRKVLVLGGYGLVGTAVCRALLARHPKEIVIHSLREEEAESARREILPEAGETIVSVSSGDIFDVDADEGLDRVRAQIGALDESRLDRYRLYRLLTECRPDITIDCVNTATGIAYRDVFSTVERLCKAIEKDAVEPQSVIELLEALYIPRLIRHLQVLYRGMADAETGVYMKVGTSGTGGMGLNVPYTHSEEKPSRVLLSKSAIGGAHTMLLFLMARTPGAPITKEIKPAAAIAWKKIGHGPILRRGSPIRMVDARPTDLGDRFSTLDPDAAHETDEELRTAYIDTGENGVFSLEEFALLTTAEQMEFVTPEEIADYLIFEIEGGNTGHDVINALDHAVLGPTYRAGLLRHWALEKMIDLEKQGETRSVTFEILGPPRNSKLLFEAHLLREAFGTMSKVRQSTPELVSDALGQLVHDQSRIANEIVSIGIPILLPSGQLIRGPRVIVPSDAEDEPVTSEKLEHWVKNGWVDLRVENCGRWIERFHAIHRESEAIPVEDTSSRHLRNRKFWDENHAIQPGKIVGWILSVEEHGARCKH